MKPRSDEVVMVISGTFYEGMGETADRRKAQPLPAGSFFALPPGKAHYVFMQEETVIQISTKGPWDSLTSTRRMTRARR